ncbi:MAG: Na+/H+ antiporter NhaC [Flavobacteriales bacterium]|nr:Na+/H+ antiporter NhaC [Flavobacteriales bacterium]|tara:strand:+ start:771 stop:2198 length:1428 start_codon:yes stop_codon:yes gene_type:complete
MNRTTYIVAIFPIIFLIILLSINVSLYGDDSLGGANQLALILAGAVAGIIGIKSGTNWKSIIEGISNSIKSVTPSIIILLLIGSLAGTWLISGIVPAMIYYGLQILNSEIFLFATAIITTIVSIATGSSWSTIATIGVALLGIGQALGLGVGMIGGAIISGAYFGDKMSPLSDTTNLAPAMAGTDLFNHIKYMMYTTIPSFFITLILFLVLGFQSDVSSAQNIDELLLVLSTSFNITPWLFLVPIMVILLIIKKVPAIPSLLIGTLLGGFFAVIFQPNIILEITESNHMNFSNSYQAVINSMCTETNISTQNEDLNSLLSTGGMYGMLNTIWLIVCAMIFGGIMEVTGLLRRISEPIINLAKTNGSLVATTAGTCIFFNITASDQYISIVVPGRMFIDSYKEKGLAPENLSRTLEDSGTVTSVLIPWNTCGATQSAVLGVATFTYLPYCFFNLISPIMTIVYAYLGIKIKKLTRK